MPYYQGDMLHCKNYKCGNREQCYRYWLGERAKYYGGLVSMLNKDEDMDKCEHFLDIRNY